ncbi:IPT/TIG domain-containing protein [Kaistella montana]|uniref:IPT/TIG domain-containing protein n=1 Tax=Kaistella montana TaxID=1849733 RepID=A0ABW5KAY9_9FLAO|nr:IPT/TIG domain-containing protein [Kaistella montana]MCQ4035134.1 IPT/TIG domain-containing protein [Kaistella montana]
MKNIFKFSQVFIIALLLGILVACRDDSGGASDLTPVIELVSASVNADGQPVNPLEATHVGYANNTYIIKGKNLQSVKHVYFNSYESTFNSNFVTDGTIIITIDQNTPYTSNTNKLEVVTTYGTAEYDFVIAPPAPVFNGFQPINAPDGSTITIKGNYFVNPTVTVGDQQATIVSYTLTEIIATLPAGSQGKKVSVSTLSGSLTYPSQIGTSIYDDAFYGAVTNSTWSGDVYDIAYAEDPANIWQGTKAIKWSTKAWSAFQIDNSPSIPSNAKGIRFHIKSNATINQGIKIILNYSWAATPTISAGTSYEYVEIPFSQFGLSAAPDTMNLTFNNANGDSNDVYLDDIGYYY